MTSLRNLVFLFIFSVYFLSAQSIDAQTRLGANNAAPAVHNFLEKLPLVSGTVYTLSAQETLEIVKLSSAIGINVFELIDCTYRYLSPKNMRITITGTALRNTKNTYDLGEERIEALLPIDLMISLEIGAVLSSGQHAMDVYLMSKHQSDIEIGTAFYESKFGFSRISPLLFSEPYGVSVKKFLFTSTLDYIELYEPSKVAIYAKNVSRPKKWVIRTITVR